MKNGGFTFSAATAVVVLILAGSLTSCEPETIENQLPVNEMNSLGDNEKQSMKDYPKQEIAQLRAFVAPFHNFDKAIEAGYSLEFTGYRTQMGYHYLKAELLDDKFELLAPEVLIYAPAPNGEMRFVGVEYATLIPDLSNPPAAPEGFSGTKDEWSINTEFSVWTLHAWVGLQNPNGIFAMRNPRLP